MYSADFSRRSFFRQGCCTAAGLAGFAPLLAAHAAAGKKTDLTPDQALEKLKKGNSDFLNDKPALLTLRNSDRRMEIARSQVPFAVLLGCSDSRVPPEVLFNTGLGELFIVRNAGNTIDTVALGSLEYAIQVLGVPLVLVLGHERCGAVDAAVSVVEKNAVYPGSIGRMVEPIIPAVLKARASGNYKGEELLDMSVRENVRRTVERLQNSEPGVQEPMRAGKLKVVGARYDLDNGKVDFFMT
ncbi:MAG: carbonic anhydrase [Polaromonas sp.]|nr:carbonic anhydrase [Polaromonas sp.]